MIRGLQTYLQQLLSNTPCKRLWITGIALFTVVLLPGQQSFPLRLHYQPADSAILAARLDSSIYAKADSVNHSLRLQEIIENLRASAYLEAAIDSLVLRDSLWHAHLHIGREYRWGRFNVDAIDPLYLAGSNAPIGRLSKDPVYYDELLRIMDNILERAENRGYPFASLRFEKVHARNDTLEASLLLDRGRKLYLDSIDVRGDARINPNVLHRYLDLEKGAPFRKAGILDVPRKISELPYLSMQGNPQVYFLDDDARLVLNLGRRNASRFDFLIGVLPQSGIDRRAIITGNFLADLVNQFALGERVFVEFQRLRPQTQQLAIKADFPYVPIIPFGLEGSFSLHKQDTLYTELDWLAGLQYVLSTRSTVGAFLEWESTRLIGIPRATILQQRALPANLDINSRGFGLSYTFQNLDYFFNPRKGLSATITGSASTKRIIKNNEILELEAEVPEFRADSLYNTLNLQSEDFSIELEAAWFFPLGGRSALRAATQSAIILSEQTLFNNEVYRIGGVHSLRGFDEESIFADRYTILTGEYRLLLDRNSFLSVFTDWGFYRNRTRESDIAGRAVGFGAGISFETKAGIFALSTALGSFMGNPVDFRAAKIHFGYVNLF